MNQSPLSSVHVLVPIAAALTLLVGSANAQISDNVVKVGVMADMTGPYSGNGGPGSVIAARMAVADFGGTVNGVPIEVVVADDQNKPDVGLNLARKWIENDKVDTIIGGSASSIALGVQTLMREKQKPYLLAGTLTADLTGKACSPMSIQFLADTYAEPKAMVRTLLDQGVKTFFFVTVDYAFGQAMQSEATRFIETGGGKVLGSVKHPLGASDFSSYLLQAQGSGAKAIVVISAGLDLSNTLKQAAEFRITRGGQILTTPGMTINSVTAMGLNNAQGLQFTVPFYWDRDDDSRGWSKRYMEKSNGVVPTWIHAAHYSAMLHYLNAVKSAGTDAGPAVMAKMRATPINDFQMKNVPIREDGQAMRPNYAVVVKSPAESKGKFDYYKIGAEIPPEQAYRPLSEGGCPLVTAAKN
jgi:branched-chain amino acid transport system substrate-binding protein